MRAPAALAEFVRDALGRGRSRAEIAAALRAAGWTGAEVETGLADWADADGLPPVPRPRATASPRDALLHGVLFVALGFIAFHLGAIAFALVDRGFPDPADDGAASGGMVRWAVAALVVAWPVWALLTLALARAGDADPAARRSSVGRWLTAAALFIAGVVGLADLIGVFAAFLQGEITVRFLLKAAVVGAIAVAVIAIYRPALWSEDAPMPPTRARRLVALTGAVVALVAAAGVAVFGGPAESLRDERDARRLSDLQSLSTALACHAEAGAAPPDPAMPAAVSPACLAPGQAAALVDPLTGDAYPIDHPQPGTVRVCAVFERAGETPRWAPPSFDAATGCLASPLPAPANARNN